MSPRRRGRGRHGSASGATGGAAGGSSEQVRGAGSGDAGSRVAGSGATLAERPADGSAEGSHDRAMHQNGNQPNGVGVGPAIGQPGGQRRRPMGRAPERVAGPARTPASAVSASAAGEDVEPLPGKRPSCTLAQMRRFIKSRPYVPVHELRRRFEIGGVEDEVSPVATERGTIYVGLPPEQAQFLGDLIKAGEVGCELLLDPDSPAVVGVFPMRPVARQ